jgi:hypothetical protein
VLPAGARNRGWTGLFPAKSVPKAGLRGCGGLESVLAGRGELAGVECLAELNAAEVRHGSRVRWRVGMSYEGSLGGGSLQETGARPKHHEAT